MPETKPEVPRRSRDEVEKVALDLLRKHDLLRIPIDPIAIAQALKIRVFNAKFDDDSISGMLARRGPNITMLINASDSAFRKRFTIAHELGHRVLKHFDDAAEPEHTDRAIDFFRSDEEHSDDSNARAEVQANQFAAALLMPEPLVREQFKKTSDVDALARLFHVSSEAMGYRINTLRLL